jgi:tRNA modification GTPase
MLISGDTIAAIATPPGNGGVGIIRLSGPDAPSLLQQITGKRPQARRAVFSTFRDQDGEIIDSGIALYFSAPASFTGEDVVELQAHGGRIVLNLLLKRCLQLGARLAEPGEFSRRAFLNNKIDLTQAEAIADLITCNTEQAARSAQRSLQGVFSEQINNLLEELIELRVYVEASIDFVDEEIDFLGDGAVAQKIAAQQQRIDTLLSQAKQGRLLHDGLRVVLAGKPNAGKSSLLNALAGHQAAIVTAIAGTTRDILREQIEIDGMPLHIIDTAGLRDSDCVVEQEGVRRARAEIEQADLVLWLIDSQQSEHDEAIERPADCPLIRVYNKIDLAGQQAHLQQHVDHCAVYLSAKTGLGLDLLKQQLKQLAGFNDNNSPFIARTRHIRALEQTRQCLELAQQQLEHRIHELVAEELRNAQNQLAAITGTFHADDLLGEIFSSFCIGK